jgi:parvulin-like peptidyl-prolyl isomerase
MKRRFILSAFLVASLITALPASGEIIDRILVVVDNRFIITQSDVRRERAIQAAFGADPGDDDSLVESLIEQYLIEQQIALFRDIEIDEDRVTEQLSGIRIPQGVSADELRQAIRSGLRRREFTLQRFRPFIRVSDEEVRTYFQEVVVPELRRRGEPVPTVEQGMLDVRVRENVIFEKMNKELGDSLTEIRRRTTIEKILK